MADAGTDLEPSLFDEVLMRGGADARKELARQLSSAIAGNCVPGKERSQIVANLIKLANDPVSEVRQSVAQHLKGVSPLEADLVFAIVADEEEIALPFIAASLALDQPKLLAILRVGDELRQIQVASRRDISLDCIGHVLHAANWPVCAALLDNPAFEPSEKDYRRLYERFSQEPQIVDRLLQRDDVPLDIRIIEAKRASSRIQDYLSSAAYPTAEDPHDMIADAEETATLQVLAQAYEAELDRVMAFLLNRNMLTPSLLLRAAVVGETRVIERAIAQLSGVPLRRVQGLLYDHRSISRALFNRCGLPQDCIDMIQAAVQVERDIRQSGKNVSSDVFGARVVETIMTRFTRLSIARKLKLISYVENFGTDHPRAVAAKLKLSLNRAA